MTGGEAFVEVEHLGEKIRFPMGKGADPSAVHEQLTKAFGGQGGIDGTISGFVVDPEGGGPVVPFSLWQGLRGTEKVRLIMADTEFPPHMLPLPPQLISEDVVSAVTVRWSDIVSGDAGVRAAAMKRLEAGLRQESLAYIEMSEEQEALWDRAVQAALRFFAMGGDDKARCRSEAPDGKFVGYLSQPKREMFQVRRVPDGSSFPWPEGGGGDVEGPLRDCYEMLEGVSRDVMEGLCAPLGLEWGAVEAMLDHGGSAGWHLGGGGGEGFGGVGADVWRVFQLYRPEGSPLPGLRDAGTGLHADMGFITVAPTACLPGLTMMSPDCTQWLDVEGSLGVGEGGGSGGGRFVVFAGETLARLTGGSVRAPLHYVDETAMGKKRISAPFFLRARPDALLPPMEGTQHEEGMSVADFMENIVLSTRPWIRPPKASRVGGLLGAIGAKWGIVSKDKVKCDY